VGSTLKVRSPEAKTLIDKIKAEIKKRAELKAQRMLLKEPKRKPKHYAARPNWGEQLLSEAIGRICSLQSDYAPNPRR
jgi:hypothetical protein